MAQYSDLVHICLPTHNGEDHLAEALDSLLAQTHRNIEIVIMDNASSDATPRIAQDYARRDSRIRYFRSDNFVCASENWNRTFEKINRLRSAFVMFAGDDDLWAPDYLELMVLALSSNRDCALSFSNYDQIGPAGETLVAAKFGTNDWRSQSQFETYRWLLKRGGGHCAICGLMRVEALNWTPVMEDTCFGSDLWFLLKLATRGNFFLDRKVRFFKRMGGISTTGEDPSVSKAVEKTWNIGATEWGLIDDLHLSTIVKRYLYYRLQVLAKLYFPEKEISALLWPWFAVLMLKANPRGLGLRRKLKQKIRMV